ADLGRDLGDGDLDEMGARRLPGRAPAAGAALGPRIPRAVGGAQPGDTARDRGPDGGAVWVRTPPDPPRLSGLALGARTGPLAGPRPVRLAQAQRVPLALLRVADRTPFTHAPRPWLARDAVRLTGRSSGDGR